MMKYRMRAALLAGLILMSLAGCAANQNTADGKSHTDSHNQTVTADVTSDTKPSDDIPADNTVSSAATEKPAEKESDAPQNSEPADTEKPKSSPPAKNEVPETPKPAPSEPPKQTEAPKEETKPADPPVTAPPAESKPTEPPTPAFDIGYWISYAQNYATSIGLRLENSAVDCWDNPIIAGAHCIYLERDIQSRLNWYNRDEDITDVWIWAEPRADGSFDLYIGYA